MLSMVEKGAGSKARLAGEQSNAGKQSQAGRQAKRQATGHNRQARLKAQENEAARLKAEEDEAARRTAQGRGGERRLQPDLPPALTPAAEHAELGHPSISVRPPGPSTARSESPGYPSL